MTTLDLRIKYKSETGYMPAFENESFHSGKGYKGKLTSFYAEWLEGKNNAIQKRMAYQRDTGDKAGFYEKRCIFKYAENYKLWLEERRCICETILGSIR